MKKNNKGVLNNLIWKFSERISAQAVTFIVSIVLARMLEPRDYGVISMVMIFISLANIFVSDGFGSALIQKKDADILDFSSVFYFNFFLSIMLYCLLFSIAPFISEFYGEGYEILTPVLRMLGLQIIISSINTIQQSYVSRKMIFKKFFYSTLFGTIASAVVGIAMAYMGFGVWALVAQYLTNSIVNTIVLQIILNKWPKLMFSFRRIKGLIDYGYKVLLTSLIITGYQELRALIIGKLYSSNDLAFYDKGRQFPNLIVTNINTSIGAVLFPKLAQEQNDTKKVKELTRISVRFSSYCMSPLMLGLAVVAEPVVRIILTEKWLACVNLMQIFCLFYLLQPIHTANTQAIKAIGRSDIALKYEIIRDIIQSIALVAVMWISVEAIVISMAVLSFLFLFLNAIPNIQLINYRLSEQLGDIFPAIGMATIMAIIVYFVGFIDVNLYLKLGIQIIVGAIVYIAISVILKNKEFELIVSMIKEQFFKKIV